MKRRISKTTTTTAPWSSELRFLHSKSNIPTNQSVEFSCKDFGSSLLAENVTPNNFSPLLSPLGGASMNTVACSLRATKTVYAPFAFHMDVNYSVGVGD
ncbi:hypothetical protein CMV_026265 [Castanea mollissima]|uniref:Uncharacterized protein n=1 Tax=Castanea mollissima TaxID=60419 RepID=A0A8J4QK96_9ROSI|nr:hypothetical protein CMV_026265 [Castanea mollissima]